MAEIAKTKITWHNDNTEAVSGRLLVASRPAALADMTEVATFQAGALDATVERGDALSFWKVVNVGLDGTEYPSDDYAVTLPIREPSAAAVVQAAALMTPVMTAYSPVNVSKDGLCNGLDALTGKTTLAHGPGRAVYLANGSKIYRLRASGDSLTLTQIKDLGSATIYGIIPDNDGTMLLSVAYSTGMSTWGVYRWDPRTGTVTQLTSTTYERLPSQMTRIGRKLCLIGFSNGQAGFGIDVLDLDTLAVTSYGITGGSTQPSVGQYWSGELAAHLVIWSSNQDFYVFDPIAGTGTWKQASQPYRGHGDTGPRNGIIHDANTIWFLAMGGLYEMTLTNVTYTAANIKWPSSGAPDTYLFTVLCGMRTPEGGHLFLHKTGSGGFYINSAGTAAEFFNGESSTDAQYCAIIDGEIYGFTPGSLSVRRLQWRAKAPVIMPDVYLQSPYTAQGRA